MKQITKRIMAYVLTFVMVFSGVIAVQPTKAEAASSKYVKSLKVSTKASVAVGAKKVVKVTVKVAGKASTKVKVKSSNKKVVTASYSAKTKKITLKGVKEGTAKVTVTTTAKNKKGKAVSKTIKVTVTKKATENPAAETPVPTAPAPTPTTPTPTPTIPTPAPTNPTPTTIAVKSVSLTESKATILKGNSKQLFAIVTPDNATNRSLKWSSSASDVATVSDTGLVKAVSKGTSVITVENVASGKKATCTVTVLEEVTVTTQNELEAALSSSYTGKIILKPAVGTEITISTGNYAGTDLVIQAGEDSKITNNGLFGNVSISGGTYYENAASNSLLITGTADVKIGENSSVDVTVAIADNSDTANVKLENNGTISNLAIQSAGTVSIKGTSSSELPIPVSISAENVTLSSSQNIEVNATAKAHLVLTGDTDKTSITVDKVIHIPTVSGVGFIPYTVTETGATGTIAAEASDDLGPVDIEGLVKDAYTGEELSDVAVYLIPYDDYKEDELTGDSVVQSKTDDGGNYRYEEVDSGNYYLVVKKENYKDAVQLLTASSRFNTVYINEVMELLDKSQEDSNSAYISGTVKDAANGEGIADITVELRKNKGNIIGAPIMTVTTDETGNYSFNALEADQYTLQFKDNRETNEEKYILLSENVCVKANQSTDGNTTLSKPIKGSGTRFVLTWGSRGEGVPSDLDTHLFAPTIDGSYKEIYFYSKYYSIGNQVYAMLDVDDIDYDGPETATILSDLKGIYYYYVFNYTEKGNLPTSQARVDVYSGNELLTSYNVPSTQANSGNWWKVCSYNSANGNIISYNSILDELDLNQEYRDYNIRYVESIESSLEQVEWNILPDSDEYYENLYITGSEVNWNTVKDSLTITMTEGYSFAWEAGIEDGIVAVLDILKDGKKVGYYNVYYLFDVALDITGDGVMHYQKSDSEIKIYSITGIDYNSLNYTVIDSRLEAVVESSEYNYYLVIRWKDSKEEVRRYHLYNYDGYYISNVTGASYITGFDERSGWVDVYYDYDYDGDLNWSDVTFVFANGYTGKIVQGEEDDYVLQIEDISGDIVATKTLYWEWAI